jgi:hypothetical protein
MKLGATGKFPQGKISGDDEGELNCAISSLPDGSVRIDFGTPVVWLVMPREMGFNFAKEIMRRCVDQVVTLDVPTSSPKSDTDTT